MSWSYEDTLMVARDAKTNKEMKVALQYTIELLKHYHQRLDVLEPIGRAVEQLTRGVINNSQGPKNYGDQQ